MRLNHARVLAFASLLSLSCNAGTATISGPANDGASGQGGSSGDAGGGAGDGGSSGDAGSGGSAGGVFIDPGKTEDCGDVGKVIFVVTDENVLLQYDPKGNAFSKIGDLSCPSNTTPFSMAVDREGYAFVLYHDGKIFRVSTKDASCQSTSYQPGQSGFETFGMGYVSDSMGATTETLFVIDGTQLGSTNNHGLAKIDGTGHLSSVAQFDKGFAGRTAEVTGTGDGRLFAFFVDPVGNSSVAEIEKTTGHIITDAPQTSLPPVEAWAFAHWGGSFFLFNSDGSGNSRVDRYTPGKTTDLVVPDAGYQIVGAGVSTCAPTTGAIN